MKTKSKIIIGSVIGTFVLVAIILIVNFTSFNFIGAEDLSSTDNKITYEKNDMKVNFKDEYNTPLGTIELKSHSSVTEIKKVGFGQEEVVMYYDFTNWVYTKDGLGKVIFTDMKTGKEIEKDYKFVIWKEVEINVNDYIEVCSLNKINNSEECESVLSGTHKEMEYQWVDYIGKDIPEGNSRIGLKTYVGKDDWIDGIWTIAGKEVKKHASWEEGEYDTLFTCSEHGTGNAGPSGIVILGDYAYVDSYTGGVTYKYFKSNFTYTGTSFSSPGYNADIDTDGTYFYYGSDTGEVISIYWINGTLKTTFSTSAQGTPGNPNGAATDGTSIWVMNYHTYIDRYNMAGVYQDHFATGYGTTGIEQNGTFIWITDNTAHQIKKYFMNGTYHSYWTLNTSNAKAYGLALDGDYIYVSDKDDGVYRYYEGDEPALKFNITGLLRYSNGTGVSAGKIIATNEDFTKTNYTITSNGTGHWVIENVINSTYVITGYSTNASVDGDVEAHVVV